MTEPQTIPLDVKIETFSGSASKCQEQRIHRHLNLLQSAAIIAFSADSFITGTSIPIPCVITIPNIASIAAPSTDVGIIVVNPRFLVESLMLQEDHL